MCEGRCLPDITRPVWAELRSRKAAADASRSWSGPARAPRSYSASWRRPTASAAVSSGSVSASGSFLRGRRSGELFWQRWRRRWCRRCSSRWGRVWGVRRSGRGTSGFKVMAISTRRPPRWSRGWSSCSTLTPHPSPARSSPSTSVLEDLELTSGANQGRYRNLWRTPLSYRNGTMMDQAQGKL